MRVSVLIPYFQGRRALLERTLWLLGNQTYDNYNVWVLDDGSDENIEELCGGKIIYVPVREAGAQPRASNMAWNYGYRISDGEFVILTHPEYMAPLHAIESLVNQYDGSARLEPVALALSPSMLGLIDEFDWKADLDSFQHGPAFWDYRTPWGWTNFDANTWCHHFAFTGQDRAGWNLHDFIPETETRGMNDSWLVKLEVESGRVPQCVGWNVYHQHHERTTEWPFPPRSVRVKRIMGST